MRIISGKAGGRKLVTPPGRSRDIRPTADRAREALFNILGERVVGARVLDLYAGTGALGLEALSRGASQLILVDHFRPALDIISRNIGLCASPDDNVALVRHDLRKGLPPALLRGEKSHPFDLIFLDPPYDQGLSLLTLQHLDNSNLLAPETLIVAEDRSSESLPDALMHLELTDTRRYGDTGFWLYQVKAGAR